MNVVVAMQNPFERFCWPAGATASLQQEFPELAFHEVRDAAGLAEALPQATVLLGPLRNPELLRRAPLLRWVHTPTAAVHDLLFPAMVASDVVLTNGSVVHGSPVAEHALALLLALSRNLPLAAQLQAQRSWGQAEMGRATPALGELRGSTVVLVGLGEIGRVLAGLLAALAATVLGVRRHAAEAVPGCVEVHPPAALDRLLPRAAFLVLAVPVTEATRALIGAAQLALLPRGARLVNVGRGELLDEVALAEALNSGHLAAAALDVFRTEPLPAASPLWTTRNLFLTPHIGGVTAALWPRQIELIKDNLRRFLRGEALRYVVDKARGY